MQAQPNRHLVGTAEIADLLGLSRQRADQLTRTQGFPEAVRLVLPIDERTRETMRRLESEGTFPGGTADQCFDAIVETAHRMPDSPRLWRATDVERWAADTGRSGATPGATT